MQCYTLARPQLKNLEHLLHGRIAQSVYRQEAPHCRTVLQNRQDRRPKPSVKKQSIILYSPGLLQDNKPFIMESHLGNTCHSNICISMSSNSVSTVLIYIIVTVSGVTGDGCAWPGDYHSLLAFIFILQRTHHLLTFEKRIPFSPGSGTAYNSNSNAWGWHNSGQSGLIGRTNKLILQYGMSSIVCRKNNNGSKLLPKLLHTWSNVNQFIPKIVNHYVLWSIW